MKLIELHILQSFPVSCLNRDDVGAPKTATFGGVNRARISSQAIKRPARISMHEQAPNLFAGQRTKLLSSAIQDSLGKRHKVPAKRASELARAAAGLLNKKDGKALSEADPKMESLFYTSPRQTERMADLMFEEFGLKGEVKPSKKKFVNDLKAIGLCDAADVALFGRMVASDPTLTLEGAAMFSHALSTHRADNDLDFFSALDDLQDKNQAGAAHTDSLEFSSAVYYRYAALNLGLLADDDHLAKLSLNERRQVVDAFIRATLMAIPGARKNSMNAHTEVGYALGLYKSAGQPLQLINAFENPVRANSGLLEPSVKKLKEHHAKLKETWGIVTDEEVALPDVNLNAFCEALVKHVI